LSFAQQREVGEWEPMLMLNLVDIELPFVYLFPGLGMPLVAFSELLLGFKNNANVVFAETEGFSATEYCGKNAHENFSYLVRCYCDQIKAINNKGPYHLAGFSFGGAFAFEVAKLLEEEGEQVQVTLIDSHLDKYCMSDALNDINLLKQLLQDDYRLEPKWLNALSSVDDAYDYLTAHPDIILAVNQFYGMDDKGMNSILGSFLDIYIMHFRMLIAYQIEGRIDGQINFLMAEGAGYSNERVETLKNYIGNLTCTDLCWLTSPGTHRTMIRNENTQQLVKHITGFLEADNAKER